MAPLSDLPNIGKQLANELEAAGFLNSDQLVEAGSLGVAAQLSEHGFSVCNNKLYALEGAIRGIRWHDISADERSALWEKYLVDSAPP